MYIVFSQSRIYTLPEWLYEESLYIKYDYIYDKNYSIEEITVNPSFQKKEVWNFFKMDLPYIHFPQILQSSDFASFFRFLKMKKEPTDKEKRNEMTPLCQVVEARNQIQHHISTGKTVDPK